LLSGLGGRLGWPAIPDLWGKPEIAENELSSSDVPDAEALDATRSES
jgi:hypothetical protein